MRDLVLLPGFMCDSDLWRDVAPDLGKLGPLHYGNVYQDDTLEGMAERILSEAPERFVLIGFSMGGFVARVLTLMAPGRVTGVAFVASSAREYTEAERARRRQGALPGDRPRRASPGVALGLHPDRERDPVLLERLREMQRRLGPEVRAHQSAL
ncbi:MAG TPA: alpha/beta fold hydrolase, partial [Reyranella sp.]|nr:alpha/beta fold hydrolase [Reyranella sp.]